MKFKSLILAALCAVAACFTAPAQILSSNSAAAIALDPFLASSNIVFVVGPSYAPHLPQKFGATFAALYKMGQPSDSQSIWGGYRLDYLNDQWAVSSVTATYQVAVVLWGAIHLQPYFVAGPNIGMSGQVAGKFGVAAGAGVNAKILSFGQYGELDAGLEYENWTILNDSAVYHGLLVYNAPIENLLQKLASIF